MANFTMVLVPPVPITSILSAGQGPAGPMGSVAAVSYPAAVAIGGHTAVVLNAAGQVLPATAEDPTHQFVVGITTHAVEAGNPVFVLAQGIIEHLGWTFLVGVPVILGLAGALTQQVPPTALFFKSVGVAVSPSRVSLSFQPAIFN